MALSIALSCPHATVSQVSLSDYCVNPGTSDDTPCLTAWLDAGRAAPDKELYASAGTYLYSGTLTPYSGMRLVCPADGGTTFKRTGLGTGALLASTTALHDVAIEHCSFDVNGSHENFLAVISINPSTVQTSERIRIKYNHIYDSAISGSISGEQRQYITLINCTNCLVEGNHLSEGGMIKVGQPGSHLIIRHNQIEQANDHAITVVDKYAGTSQEILIQSNTIISPKGIGIFFGADGDGQNDPALTTKDVNVINNQITGDWSSACIMGTLPNVARHIVVRGNRCEKTGTTGGDATGISIRRTATPQLPAQQVKVEGNTVFASGAAASGTTPALDQGGIYAAGTFDRLEVHGNIVQNVGPRAIHFASIQAVHSSVVHNAMTGGSLIIEGTFEGENEANQVSVGRTDQSESLGAQVPRKASIGYSRYATSMFAYRSYSSFTSLRLPRSASASSIRMAAQVLHAR